MGKGELRPSGVGTENSRERSQPWEAAAGAEGGEGVPEVPGTGAPAGPTLQTCSALGHHETNQPCLPWPPQPAPVITDKEQQDYVMAMTERR